MNILKNKKLILLILIVFIATVIVTVAGKDKYFQGGQSKMQIIKVGGLIATYEYIRRDVDIEYFYSLDNTTTYSQIEKAIGKPNGGRGSGIVLPYYEVDDMYVVIDFCYDKNGDYDKVVRVDLCDSQEFIKNIYPRAD